MGWEIVAFQIIGKKRRGVIVTISVEVQEIKDYLAACVPFDQLPENLLAKAAKSIQISYYRKGSQASVLNYQKPQLYIVRTGAFEVRSEEGDLVDRVAEGGYFGYPSLLTGDAISNRVAVIEDGLLYQIDEETFSYLRSHNRPFERFFHQAHAKRLKQAVLTRNQDHQLARRVRDVITPGVVTIDKSANVADAARMMTEQRVSSILVMDQEELIGIITDRDMRSRVLAQGKGSDTPVTAIMTPNPITVSVQDFVFEATMLMTEHNIHYLPVVADSTDRIFGVLSTTDLVKAQKSDPVYLISEISRQEDISGLKEVSRDIPMLLRNLIEADAKADEIGRIITSVSDAFTKQLILQAQEKLGKAPVPFAWLAFGSQGRQDQTAISDQDNALLIDDSAKPEHDQYFSEFADYVCTGLDACGYVFCPGEIMAKTPRWRQSLRVWKDRFQSWINEPDSKALMHTSIFFDMRRVYGEQSLFDRLHKVVCDCAKGNDIFLAYLTQNALKTTPPLGFFKTFVLERDGDHINTLDLKHRGVVPIIDLARVYALSVGMERVNTIERLQALAEDRVITRKDARNLLDAYEFISHQRLLHQGNKLARSEKPDNYLIPDEMSDLVRHQLKDAFEVVNQAQSALRLKFTRGFM